MLKLLSGAACAAALCCAVVPAATGTTKDALTVMVTGDAHGLVRTQVVMLGDLDLRRDAEVARADSRIRFASKQVCDPSSVHGLHQKRDYGRCFAPAYAGARSDLDRHVAQARSR